MSTADTTPPQSARDDIDLRGLIAILRRQLRVMAATMLIVALGTVLFLALSKPVYRATALVLVDPQAGDLLDDTKLAPSGSGPENARVDTEVEILRSDAVALSVIDRLHLATDPEFLPSPGALAMLAEFVGAANAAGPETMRDINVGLLDNLRNRLTIKRRGLTYLISVSAQSHDPYRAAELANTLSETYIDAQLEARVASTLSGRDLLAGRIEAARGRMADLERQLDMFLLVNLADEQLSEPGLLTEVQGYLAEAEARRTQAQDLRNMANDGNWGDLAGHLKDAQLGALATARAELAPQAISQPTLAAELQRIDAALATKAEGQLIRLDNEARALDRKAAALRESLQAGLPVGALSADQLADLYALQQDAALAREQYQQLLSRMRELETRASVEVATSSIVSPAIVPTRPSFPDTGFVMLVAIALAAGMGVSLAFVNEYLIGGVTSEPQLADLLHMPVTGEIPAISIATTGSLTPADRVIDAPLSAYAEAIRKLRAGIDQTLRSGPIGLQRAERGAVILVTSATPGEGKSTAALALARTYAAAGRKTLLVDGDLRNPSIHRQLGFQPDIGFQDYLRDPSNPADVRAFYAKDPSSPLAMILGSSPSLDTTDQLVCSDTFANILAQARDVYDVTILDSPPLLPVVDPRYMARLADVSLLVVKWGATAQNDIRTAAQHLRKALGPTAAILPVISHSRSTQAMTSYAGYYSDERHQGL